MEPEPTHDQIATVLLDLARGRGAGKTFCPSDAAKALCGDWRPVLPSVRAVAAQLQAAGRLQATQQGRRVDPDTARGPIRLGLPAAE